MAHIRQRGLRGIVRSPFLSGPYGQITDEMRDKALARTAEIVGKLDAIRKRLELAPEHLDLVADAYNGVLMQIEHEQHEQHEATMAADLAHMYPNGGPPMVGDFASPEAAWPGVKRTPMPMSSTDKDYRPLKLKAGDEPFVVIARPQCVAYRVEEIEIHGNADRWMIDDIRVGHRSQLVISGSLPGALFAKGALCNQVKFDTLQTAMDFAMVVRRRAESRRRGVRSDDDGNRGLLISVEPGSTCPCRS